MFWLRDILCFPSWNDRKLSFIPATSHHKWPKWASVRPAVALHGSVAQKVVSGNRFVSDVATSNGETLRHRQVLVLHAHWARLDLWIYNLEERKIVLFPVFNIITIPRKRKIKVKSLQTSKPIRCFATYIITTKMQKETQLYSSVAQKVVYVNFWKSKGQFTWRWNLSPECTK